MQLIAGTESILKWEQLFYGDIADKVTNFKGKRSGKLYTALASIKLDFGQATNLGEVFANQKMILPLIMSQGKSVFTKEKAKFGKVTSAVETLQKTLVDMAEALQASTNPKVQDNAEFMAIYNAMANYNALVSPLLTAYNDKIETIRGLLAASSAKDKGPRRASIVAHIEFEAVMDNAQNGAIKSAYYEFVKSERSPENYEFVVDVKRLKRMAKTGDNYDTKLVPEMNRIWNKYCKPDPNNWNAPLINLPSTISNPINAAKEAGWKPNGAPIDIKGDTSLWSQAYDDIFNLQKRDTYPRFQTSKIYIALKLKSLSALKDHETLLMGKSITKDRNEEKRNDLQSIHGPNGDKIIEQMTKSKNELAARREEQNEYDLYGSYGNVEYVPNVQAIDGYGQQRDWQRDYYYHDAAVYDPTLIVAGMAVFALLICCMFMVSIGVGFGCYVFGRMSPRNGGKLDEIVYDVVDQQRDDDNI